MLIWSGAQHLAEHDPKAYQKINTVLRDAASNTICGRAFASVITRD